MNRLKKTVIQLPEYYLILLIVLAGYKPVFSFNPLMLGIAAIIGLQIILKNRISGLIIAGLFLLLNLLMLGAVISELQEFMGFNDKAIQLLIGGVFLWIVNFIVAGLMFYKYVNMPGSNIAVIPQAINL